MKRKILVISLLRLGDVVLATPALRGLRERHRDDEIHILINSQFKQVADLIPYVDRVLLFERDDLQQGLGNAELSLFEPYERLKNLVDALHAELYDVVINLTQNRLSGYVMRLLEGPQKIGLSLDADGKADFGSPWFRYLNCQAALESEDVFHFIDVFRFALGLDTQCGFPTLLETRAGRAECHSLLDRDSSGGRDLDRDGESRDFILVQPLTSDEKKDWGLDRFAALIRASRANRPDLRVFVLAAPNETQRLLPMMESLRRDGVEANLAVCSLAGAFSMLRRARAIVSGDTSVKHLAAAARTPLIEISVGSSDFHRTGAYSQNSVIIQSKEICAPCPHSQPCHRERRVSRLESHSHLCAERVSVEAVALVLAEVLTGDLHQLRTIAEEFAEEIDIYRVEVEESGFWAAWSVRETFSEASVARWLSLSGQKVVLEEERLKASGGWGELGSESVRLERLLRKMHPEVRSEEWLHLFAAMETQAMGIEGRISGFESALRDLYGGYENPERLRSFIRGLIVFRERLKSSPVLRASKATLDQLIEDDVSAPFVRVRRIVNSIQEIRERTCVELKLIRAIKNRMEACA